MAVPPEQGKEAGPARIRLMPCAGRKRLGIPSSHVYKVEKNGQTLGYFSLKDAQALYPKAIISQSSSLCPSCAQDIRRR